MIIYDLCCQGGHRFEGWFRDAGDFAAQRDAGHLSCPVCDSDEVRRLPSAVALAKGATPDARRSENDGPRRNETVAVSVPPSATQVLAAYRQFLAVIRANSENVGRAFANEARKIHAGEQPERAIYGEASAEECQALAEEGIDVIRLPDVSGDDLN